MKPRTLEFFRDLRLAYQELKLDGKQSLESIRDNRLDYEMDMTQLYKEHRARSLDDIDHDDPEEDLSDHDQDRIENYHLMLAR